MELDTRSKLISSKISMGHSAFILVRKDELERTAIELYELVREAGFRPLAVSASEVRPRPDSDVSQDSAVVIVLTLPTAPNERTTRFCKHIADDFRKNRVGLLFPNGVVAVNALPIHCSLVITTQSVLRDWGRDSYPMIPEYYSVIEVG